MLRFVFLLLACCISGIGAPSVSAADPPSFQSDPRGALAADRTVDIEHLALDLLLDVRADAVQGSATLTARPLRSGLREIRLHAVGLAVQGVTVDGVAAPHRQVGEQLIVGLPASSDVSAHHALRIEYSAQPQLGLHFRHPGSDSPDAYDEVWSQGEDTENRYWLPTWDQPDDRFTYEGRFTVPERFVVVSNGRLTARAPHPTRPGWTTWAYALQEQDLVSYLVMVAAAEYRVFAESWRGKPVVTYFPPDVDEATARRTTGRTMEMLDFMSAATGVEYAYPGYSQVFVQRFLWLGMENTSATVLERNLLVREDIAPHQARTQGVIAHELAHQWFGDLLTMRDFSHRWLNEGITTFLESLWWERAMGPEEGADRMFARVRATVEVDDRGPRPLVVPFFALQGESRSNNVYVRGALVMQMLRVLLGEEDFGRAFRLYATRHQGGLVTTDDLQRAFEDSSGLALGWFFQQWTTLAGHPTLTVESEYSVEGAALRVTVRQTQTASGLVPRFVLPLDLEVGTADGGALRHRLWLDGDEAASVLLPLLAPPRYVAADPEGGLLADLTIDQPDEAWMALLAGSPSPHARRAAWDAVMRREGPPSEALRAFAGSVLADAAAHPLWRRLAAGALGAWKDEAAIGVLVAALGRLGGAVGEGVPGIAQDPLLQVAIAQALGATPARGAAAGALTALVVRGTDDEVRGEALKALGTVVRADVVPAARRALQGPAGAREVLWRVGIDLVGAHGDISDLGRLQRFRAPSMVHAVRVAALGASAKIAARQPVGKERDAARALVARDAELGLGDRHYRMQQAAVGVLGEIGDAGSIAPLLALQSASTVPTLRVAVADALAGIRGRQDADPPATTGEVDARIEGLDTEIDALQERLKRLEEQP